jgi:hypothetical protein
MPAVKYLVHGAAGGGIPIGPRRTPRFEARESSSVPNDYSNLFCRLKGKDTPFFGLDVIAGQFP